MESYIPPAISKFQGEFIVCVPVFLTKMFITKAYDDADGQVPDNWIRTAQLVVPVTGGTGTGLGDGLGTGLGDGLGMVGRGGAALPSLYHGLNPTFCK